MNEFAKSFSYKWIYPKRSKKLLQTIIKEFSLHPITSQILVSRGFESLSEIHEFLYGKLTALHDPNLLSNMPQAVRRILKAIETKQNILVYGDNDVDGMTGVALITEFLRKIGGKVFFNVPSRTSLKNSFLGDALQYALKMKCELLITVDCGIGAVKEIEEVASHGIDVIVTDHHEPTSKLPHTSATINPKLINSTYPNRELTGVGVAFKMISALKNQLVLDGKINESEIDLREYLDLVALGTIADMGILRGENRILVRYGLEQMSKRKRVGLAKLFIISELENKELTPNDITSKIAPRLNSLGRIADPIKGVELLLATDQDEAQKLAHELDLNNLRRQRIEKQATSEIEEYLFKNPEILQEKAIVLQSKSWHPGVIAILSARIAKEMSRPTLILAIEEGLGKGSLRTIREFPLLPTLKENRDLLVSFGGHDFAAGLTIREENIEKFKKRFILAADCLREKDIASKIHLDAKISFPELTFDLMESLSLLEPFGHDNPHPILYSEAVQKWPPKTIGKRHLKLFFTQEDLILEGMAFGLASRKKELKGEKLPIKIAFTPHVYTYHKKESLQLQIKDFQLT